MPRIARLTGLAQYSNGYEMETAGITANLTTEVPLMAPSKFRRRWI
jgi:hypothetical protein